MSDSLSDRLAREAWTAMWDVAGDHSEIEAAERECIAAAIRTALTEAAKVARHPQWAEDGDSYVENAAREIAAAIDTLRDGPSAP